MCWTATFKCIALLARFIWQMLDILIISLQFLRGSKKRKTTEPKKGLKLKEPLKEPTMQTEEAVDGPSEMATEALNILIKDIQETSNLVEARIKSYQQRLLRENRQSELEARGLLKSDNNEQRSLEENYLTEMKGYQFG